jgi:Family of unknown function (DUF6502)
LNTRPNDEPVTGTVLQTLASCLAPLVRLLIARGVTYQMASEVLKRVYVETAQAHFVDDGATDSRLSLLTGLNRKEIKRLTVTPEHKAPDSMTSFAAAVCSLWRTHRRFRKADGTPKPLPRRRVGRSVGFDDLAASITSDYRPAALLDEMVRLQVVEVDSNEVVTLVDGPFLSRRDLTDRLIHLSENVADHTHAVVTNVLTDPPPFLERSVFAHALSVASAAALASRTREHWVALHDDLIARAIALEEVDASEQRESTTRIRVGLYFYSETKPQVVEPTK